MLAELHPRLPSLVDRGAAWLGRRRIPVVAALGAIACIGGAVGFASKMQSDVPLFDADLHPSQTTEVEDALTLWNEPHRENAQATQVFVPANRRAGVLFKLTLAGLPRRYVPTSADVLADPPDMLAPQTVVDDRRRSGIEGDLVAGLRRIAGVQDATVVLPPLAGDDADIASGSSRSAAVQLVLEPGASLSADAVSGIKRFVASAYPGIRPDDVTVVDASGSPLGATPPPDRAGTREQRIQGAVQSALDDVLGPGTAVVRVSVRTTGYERHIQDTRTVPRGVLSADTGHERGSESNRTYEKERSVRRYAYDTLSESRDIPADAEARTSVAVFLDARKVDAATSGEIASLVRAAAGADLQSGDDVVVEPLPFAEATPEPVARADGRWRASGAVIPAVVACAILLVGAAALPHGRSRVFDLQPAAPRVVRAPIADASVATTIASLDGESPQAAAYVIRRLPDSLRRRVLDAIAPARRTDIERFLGSSEDARV